VISLVANAASYIDTGCSPGTVATLLGSGFVKGNAMVASTNPLATELNGVRVQVNGDYVPLFYASENQLNFQCPVLPPGTPVTFLIQSDTGTSPLASSTIQFATPGIFALDGSGKGQGAVLIANTGTIAMKTVAGLPSRPAAPESYISIYAAGLGPTDVTFQLGSPASLEQLAYVSGQVDVLIGGEKANVTFAGLAPGFIGLYQVNAQVPASTVLGDAVPVQIAVHRPDGTVVTSNVVTIAIARTD
jgi:adhesin/invasin